MYVGEHDGADAFDLDDDVEVASDASDVPLIAAENAAGDANVVARAECAVGEYLTACVVVGSEQAQQVDAGLRYGLYAVVGRVAVYPEGCGDVGSDVATKSLEGEGAVVCGADKEYSRYGRAYATFATRGPHCLFGQED